MYDFYNFDTPDYRHDSSMDMGEQPFVTNITKLTEENKAFRRAIWTGKHLQMTLMSVDHDIGREMHADLDQYLMVQKGFGVAMLGSTPDTLNYRQPIYPGSGIFVPGGTWHNIVNMGDSPLKLFSIYAPIQHPFGTIQENK